MDPVPAGDGVVRGIFRVWSSVYDSALFQQGFYRRVHATLKRMLDTLPEPRIVVDLGCGTAQLTRDLVDRYPSATVIGADLSHEMMVASRKQASHIQPELVQANVYALPFADGSVDLITNTISYHWYLDYESALGEVARILAPGGYFVIAALSSPLFQYSLLRRAVAVGKQRIVSPDEVASELEDAGLRVRATENVFPLTRLLVAQREE